MFSLSFGRIRPLALGIAVAALLGACGLAPPPVADGAPGDAVATAPGSGIDGAAGPDSTPPAPPLGPTTAPASPNGHAPAAAPPPPPTAPPPPATLPLPSANGQAAPAPVPVPAPAPAPPAGGSIKPSTTCASIRMAAFPWPNPPEPSVLTQIAIDQLFPEGTAGKTLLDVGRRLNGAISNAGYQQSTYLGVGCNGFAIILDLEHIESDGRRKPGAEGFQPPSQQPEFSLGSFLLRLFHAKPGYYRQIVIVVSDQAMGATTGPPSAEALRGLAKDGASALPPAFAQLPLSWQYRVIAAVYEFRKGDVNGDAQFIPPSGRMGAAVHLIRAGLLIR